MSPFLASLGIVSSLCLLVNLVVLVNLGLDLRGQRRPHTVLLLTLCISDLAGILSFPAVLVARSLPAFTSPLVCSAFVFLIRMAFFNCGGLVTLMAGERWAAMALPFWYERHGTTRKATVVAIATVLGGAVLSAGADFVSDPVDRSFDDVSNSTAANCVIWTMTTEIELTGYPLVFVVSNFVLIVVNIALNAASLMVLRRLRRSAPAGPSSLRHEEALVRMVKWLSAIFVGTSLPVNIFLVSARVRVQQKHSGLLSIFGILLFSPFFTDPAIHLVLTSRYRRRFRSLLTCAARCFRRRRSAVHSLAPAPGHVTRGGGEAGDAVAPVEQRAIPTSSTVSTTFSPGEGQEGRGAETVEAGQRSARASTPGEVA